MKEKVKVWFFVILLLIFIVGGYFFTVYMTKEKPHTEEKKDFVEEIKDYRIDKSKDYIYYINGNKVIEN